jgi:hypothetical protein
MKTEIVINSILTQHDEQKTTISVIVLEEVAEGLSREKGRYMVVLDKTYINTTDPELMSEIAVKLALLPE